MLLVRRLTWRHNLDVAILICNITLLTPKSCCIPFCRQPNQLNGREVHGADGVRSIRLSDLLSLQEWVLITPAEAVGKASQNITQTPAIQTGISSNHREISCVQCILSYTVYTVRCVFTNCISLQSWWWRSRPPTTQLGEGPHWQRGTILHRP